MSYMTNTQSEVEVDLCDLLQTMKLDSGWICETTEDHVRDTVLDTGSTFPDVSMSEDSYHSDASESSISGSTGVQPSGCAYLQALQLQLDHYPTTGGEYLEAIFTHREAFYSHPPAHRSCARGFSDIAGAMEKRVWRADRDSDAEAVVAFRYEARVIAAALY